jgi:DNA-binding transcriptional regulator YdaS (Cro superfamily)
MNTHDPQKAALFKAAEVLKGQAALAKAVGYADRRNVYPYFREDGPPFPDDKCPALEAATARAGCVVPVEELRPDIKWHRVKDKSWPCGNGRPLADFAKAEA